MSTRSFVYQIDALPSAQHRAGLAGLMLLLDHRSRQPKPRGTAKLEAVEGVRTWRLSLDQEGLEDLFDLNYAADAGERPEPRERKDKEKRPVPALRTETRTRVDPKTGKEKTETLYYYPEVLPRGAFLVDWDPTAKGGDGIWIKLWRDFVWSTLRGVPKTRLVYEQRAAGTETRDAAAIWKGLGAKQPKDVVALTGALSLGAQAVSADGVDLKDRSADALLLHFWPLAALVFVPRTVDAKDSPKYPGYSVVIPDVAELEDFCEELGHIARGRGVERSGYRPRAAIVDLPAEAALQVALQLRERLAQRLGASEGLVDLVSGFDVFHVEKDGNNVRIWSVDRVVPRAGLIDHYARTRDLWNHRFRRCWLQNLLADRPLWHGFDRLCATAQTAHTIENHYFCHDARVTFEKGAWMTDESHPTEDKSLETLVYRFTRDYVRHRLRSKRGMDYGAVKSGDLDAEVFGRERERIAKDAFLAIRSRSGADFIEYFSGTMSSVPQFLPEADYLALSRALFEETDRLRVLTLLALSAAAYQSKPKTDSKETHS